MWVDEEEWAGDSPLPAAMLVGRPGRVTWAPVHRIGEETANPPRRLAPPACDVHPPSPWPSKSER
ncbi:hypothetical protein E2C01_037981 [Portunus trituberculatus]|uniref:Uncharacterized protein n=1 Tax=Portunus trituberculatus TaxID=210409 RepID=A0A5B7FGD9_PORTR|nr:hypothetical protein [Portunus trituberculatus]